MGADARALLHKRAGDAAPLVAAILNAAGISSDAAFDPIPSENIAAEAQDTDMMS